MVVLKPKWFPNLLQASCPYGHSMRCYSSCTSKSQMSLGDFAQLALEKHQVFNGYDKAYQETSTAHSTGIPLKKKKHGCLHHHHWWRLTAEMPQPFLQRAGTAVAKCLRVGVWKTVGCCHWKAVKKTVYIYILWYIKIYIHVTCLRKKHIKNDNDKLLQQ